MNSPRRKSRVRDPRFLKPFKKHLKENGDHPQFESADQVQDLVSCVKEMHAAFLRELESKKPKAKAAWARQASQALNTSAKTPLANLLRREFERRAFIDRFLTNHQNARTDEQSLRKSRKANAANPGVARYLHQLMGGALMAARNVDTDTFPSAGEASHPMDTHFMPTGGKSVLVPNPLDNLATGWAFTVHNDSHPALALDARTTPVASGVPFYCSLGLDSKLYVPHSVAFDYEELFQRLGVPDLAPVIHEHFMRTLNMGIRSRVVPTKEPDLSVLNGFKANLARNASPTRLLNGLETVDWLEGLHGDGRSSGSRLSPMCPKRHFDQTKKARSY